jgi:hypothetical protein
MITMMGFEFPTAVKMLMLVFWVVMPCGLVGRYQLSPSSALKLEMFLRNAGIFLQVHTVSQPRRPIST